MLCNNNRKTISVLLLHGATLSTDVCLWMNIMRERRDSSSVNWTHLQHQWDSSVSWCHFHSENKHRQCHCSNTNATNINKWNVCVVLCVPVQCSCSPVCLRAPGRRSGTAAGRSAPSGDRDCGRASAAGGSGCRESRYYGTEWFPAHLTAERNGLRAWCLMA